MAITGGALPVTDCPRCSAARAFVCKRYERDAAANGVPRNRYEFECKRCGAELIVSCRDGFDPSKAVRQHAGRTCPRVLNAGGGFARGGLVPYVVPYVGIGAAPVSEPEPISPGPELKRFDGSFVGYRAWRIRDWQLFGTGGIGIPWTPGPNEAQCVHHRHHAPAEGCECGMYALARFDGDVHWWVDADVLGAVEAWADEHEHNHDRFFMHRTGFRSQYAKVILLATSEDYPRAKNGAIRALAAEHGADVCKREHLEDAAREHGQLVPDELLEWAAEGTGTDLVNAQLAQIKLTIGINAKQLTDALRDLSRALAAPFPGAAAMVAPPAARKGIKLTLRTPGPPSQGQHREGDRVKDRNRKVWQCVASGKPGSWMPEA